jgi:hypothetical protein
MVCDVVASPREYAAHIASVEEAAAYGPHQVPRPLQPLQPLHTPDSRYTSPFFHPLFHPFCVLAGRCPRPDVGACHDTDEQACPRRRLRAAHGLVRSRAGAADHAAAADGRPERRAASAACE